MSAKHVPQRSAKASAPAAVIPGYDEGIVNQDAVVDGHGGWSRRSGLRRTSTVAAAGSGSVVSARLDVHTTVELYERAATRALHEGKTLSQLACDALELYVR
jgi:hypothetical protein